MNDSCTLRVDIGFYIGILLWAILESADRTHQAEVCPGAAPNCKHRARNNELPRLMVVVLVLRSICKGFRRQ